MKRVVTCGLMLALSMPGGLWAQEVLDEWRDDGDDYDLYFGDGGDEPPGPADLTEALKQRRGYRIGRSGRYSGKGAEAARAGSSPGASDDVHTVVEGDTLWGISDRYYEDPWQWPRLWSYNPEITNPHWIYPLDQVRLSAEALAQETALAGGGGGEGPAGVGATASALDSANAVVVPRRMITPGSVFLRDQGYLDRESLKTAGKVVGGNEDHMMLSHTDEVYVRFAEGADIRAGQDYAVFREISEDERAPAERGRLVRIYGTVSVRSYDRTKGVARGVLTEVLDPVERGFSVAKVERRFDLVPPKRNGANVVAHVIASVRPRTLLSYNNVVFLDVGQGKGIEPGNRFFVVRRGDAFIEAVKGEGHKQSGLLALPDYDREVFPKEVVAELRVVKVRKDTTIALVTRSDVDIGYGDVAEMRVGF